MSKYRDRKLGKTFSFAGSDCYADNTARGHIRSAFEAGTGIVSNWDVTEHVLDYVFLKLGMNEADRAIDVPIVMTEAVANLPYSRKCSYNTIPLLASLVGMHAWTDSVTNSDDRNHIRMLWSSIIGLRHRLVVLVSTKQGQHGLGGLIIVHFYPRHTSA